MTMAFSSHSAWTSDNGFHHGILGLERTMKTVRRCYFSCALLSALFLLESFLPVQVF